ncbi:MAG: creatininase family protein [Planctomycetales bacterium]
MPPRPFMLMEANHRQLSESPPKLAVLPWGATEAHNYHLPYGTDVLEATRLAERAAELAFERGAAVVVLPTVPFGNDQQQLDQACTINLSTPTAHALLNDIVRSLSRQGIDRLVIVNGHGGNQFQPLVRDLQSDYDVLIVLANFYQMVPDVPQALFENPGDHADESETSIMLHLYPDLVQLEQAGPGTRNPFDLKAIQQPGVWTPRPWSKIHPDTGSGDPSKATAEKGRQYFEAVTEALSDVLVDVAQADKGQLPYV